jgi:hypothetical protein
MSAFSNGMGTDQNNFIQTYYAWNAISKLSFRTSKDGQFDSTNGK